MYKLIIEDDEGKTTVVPLIRDEITIGRKEGNTIRLTERNVSRRHAKLVKQNGAVFIEDVESYNGIRVNGSRINGRVTIGEGDRIQIGDYLLGLKVDRTGAGAGAAVAPPPADERTQQIPAPGAASRGQLTETQPLPSLPPGTGAGTVAMASAPPASAPLPGSNGPTSSQRAAVAPTPIANPQLPSGVTGLPEAADEPTLQVRVDGAAERDAARGAVAEQPERPARLVVVSSNFAGQQFSLAKPAMVIGRTEDNDIVVNHRSISRHHAKVLREHGHHNIVDLQSANGVRVNGEDYGKVELRKGDLIDLGHVRMRYVEAGEDFVFERDAEIQDVGGAAPGRRPLTLVIVGVALLALAGVAVAWYAGLFAGGASTVGAPPAQPSDDGQGAVMKLVFQADQALKEERWDDALRHCKEALSRDATMELARDKCKKAEAEKANLEAFDRFRAALGRSDVDGVVAAYNEIAEDSVYKDRTRTDYLQARRQYVQKNLDLAEEQQKRGSCADARRIADQVLTVDDNNPRAVAILNGCNERPGPAAAPPPAPRPRPRVEEQDGGEERRPPRPPREVEPPPTPVPSAATQAQLSQLLSEAENAYVKQQYAAAIEFAEKALRLDPGSARAYQIIGAVSCKQKDAQRALVAYRKLDQGHRRLLKLVCDQAQVELP